MADTPSHPHGAGSSSESARGPQGAPRTPEGGPRPPTLGEQRKRSRETQQRAREAEAQEQERLALQESEEASQEFPPEGVSERSQSEGPWDKTTYPKQTQGDAQRALKRAEKVARSTGQAVQKGIKPFLRWETWVAMVAVLVLIYCYSLTHVIGQNENSLGCGTAVAGTGGIDAGPIQIDPKTGVAVKESAWKSIGGWLMSYSFPFLDNKPMTKEQAAGVIGNMMRESGLTPSMPQGGFDGPTAGWVARDAPNSALIGKGGGKGVGLIQWDGFRRDDLAKLAESKGKHWYDYDLQLEFVVQELKGAEGANLAAAFNKPGLTVEEYTKIWEEKYERAGVPAIEERIKFAKDFYTNFDGGSGATVKTGGSCMMGGGDASAMDASGVVALAISIAYPTRAPSVVRGDISGANIAPQAYKDAKAKAQQLGGADPMPGLYASCDRFVATVLKNTVDKDIPWGSSGTQSSYFKNSSKWKPYNSKSQAKPGDVWVTNGGGHIIIYVGNVKGVDSIAHASYHDRVGAITPATYMKENMVDTGGRQYTGYTFAK